MQLREREVVHLDGLSSKSLHMLHTITKSLAAFGFPYF